MTGELLDFFGRDVTVFQQQIDIPDPCSVKVQSALWIVLGDTGSLEVSVERARWLGGDIEHSRGYICWQGTEQS